MTPVSGTLFERFTIGGGNCSTCWGSITRWLWTTMTCCVFAKFPNFLVFCVEPAWVPVQNTEEASTSPARGTPAHTSTRVSPFGTCRHRAVFAKKYSDGRGSGSEAWTTSSCLTKLHTRGFTTRLLSCRPSTTTVHAWHRPKSPTGPRLITWTVSGSTTMFIHLKLPEH